VEGDKVTSSYMVTLTNSENDTLGVRIVSFSEPYIEAKLSREMIEAGKSVDLMVRVKEPYEAVKDPWFSVTLETTDPQRYRLTVPIHIPQ
jgi:hypothetical protein